MKINGNYKNLAESYLFREVAQRKNAFIKAHPEADVINMGIGDVTLPLCPAVIEEMTKAVAEMGVIRTITESPIFSTQFKIIIKNQWASIFLKKRST